MYRYDAALLVQLQAVEVALEAVALRTPRPRHVQVGCALRRVEVDGGALQAAALAMETVRRRRRGHLVVVYHSDKGGGVPPLWWRLLCRTWTYIPTLQTTPSQ